MNICLFDPGLADNNGNPSANLGDLIIEEAVKKEVFSLFPKSNIFYISTHIYPKKKHMDLIQEADFIFVGGTNLLGSRLFLRKQWKLSFIQKMKINRVILLGVGWGKYDKIPNFFSRISLKAALSSNHIHSVRDNYTKQMLESAGIRNVINTGCPTMWSLNSIDQSSMPKKKSAYALVMLTDYAIDPNADKILLRLIDSYYDKIYFWPQGKQDKAYFLSLISNITKPIVILDHDYKDFIRFLNMNIEFDYIGTRLHGGIKCINARKRSLILMIDNRAAEIAKDTGLPCVDRNDSENIKKWILGSSPTEIIINSQAINRWKSQFLINPNLCR